MELCSFSPAAQVASFMHMTFAHRKLHATLGSAQRLSSISKHPHRSVISKHPHRSVIWKPGFGSQHPQSLGRGRHNIGMDSMAMPQFGVDNELMHDLAMGVVTLGGALGSLKFWDELAKRNVFPKNVSRKLVHISVGLIFMLFWPLFSDSAAAPYIASFSAAVNGLRMLAIGLGIVQDAAVVKAMTREGDYKEVLKGPLYYAMTITLATTCFWRTSPLAAIVIANLCAGDGFADLIGRKFGNMKLPYNLNKSYVGSLAMLIFGFVFSMGYHYYFSSFGFYAVSLKLVIATLIVSCVTTFVESLPISTQLDDNLTVPLTSFVVGTFLV